MEKKGKFLLSIGIFLVLTLSLFSLNVYADKLNIGSSPISIEDFTKSFNEKGFVSPNWAGYIVVKKDSNNQIEEKTIKYVEGTWVVPEVDCSSTNDGHTFIWVGIDGYGSSDTIEQIGTNSRCIDGHESYYGWWEIYPKPSNQISNFQISPGDRVNAKVEYIGKNNFNLSIKNLDTGKTFSVVKKVKKAKRSSAEWIVEAPVTSGGQTQPLADFDQVIFTNANLKMKNVKGKTIANSNWVNYEVDMAYSEGLKADASSLMPSGDSFSVTWMHS